ncbi:MAG: helix-turn-helix domain-containing protein [bacterium]|nr:helix-turn-helix domain-containing protein [bacterium]
MTSRLEQKLEQIGLSDKESAVYIASLESGPSTVVHLAEKTNIKRPTVYVAIESLTKKGLMSSVMQGKKTLFVAEDPGNMDRLIKEAQVEVSERAKLLEGISPELSSLFGMYKEGRPIVRFYEGKEGIETIRRDFAEMKFESVCSFVDRNKMHELFPAQSTVTQMRVQKQIPSRMIYTGDREDTLNDPNKYRQARWISKDKYPFSGDITIYGNRVALTSFSDNPTSVIIENDGIRKLLQASFDVAWDGLEK